MMCESFKFVQNCPKIDQNCHEVASFPGPDLGCKEKMEQNKMILVLKSSADVVTNINYGKLRRHTLCMTF